MGLNIPVSKNLPLLKIILILDENTFFSDDNPMRLAIRHWFYLAGRMQHQFEDTQCGSPFVVNECIPLPDHSIVELPILQRPHRHIERELHGQVRQEPLLSKRAAQALKRSTADTITVTGN